MKNWQYENISHRFGVNIARNMFGEVYKYMVDMWCASLQHTCVNSMNVIEQWQPT